MVVKSKRHTSFQIFAKDGQQQKLVCNFQLALHVNFYEREWHWQISTQMEYDDFAENG